MYMDADRIISVIFYRYHIPVILVKAKCKSPYKCNDSLVCLVVSEAGDDPNYI